MTRTLREKVNIYIGVDRIYISKPELIDVVDVGPFHSTAITLRKSLKSQIRAARREKGWQEVTS